jgi:hypothetical protein
MSEPARACSSGSSGNCQAMANQQRLTAAEFLAGLFVSQPASQDQRLCQKANAGVLEQETGNPVEAWNRSQRSTWGHRQCVEGSPTSNLAKRPKESQQEQHLSDKAARKRDTAGIPIR